MATGHLNPGYGDVITRFRRAKSAHPGSLHCGQRLRDIEKTDMDDMSLEEIRRKARDIWSKPDVRPTTYSNHFHDKSREIGEPTQAIPTSPGRRHKPHPSLIFMSCRLHNVPGFYNPNATVGKEAYKVDASVGPTERRQRAFMKSKFIDRPSTAAVLQYSRPQELDIIKDPRERQATEAWLKLANDQDREVVGGAIMEDYANQQYGKTPEPDLEKPYAPENKPSLHRFNKIAGPGEREKLNELVQTYDIHRPRRPRTTIGTLRYHDINNVKHVNYAHRSKRGDFLMHPEWPPSIPHHNLRGLSSVELPYGTGRR